MNANLVLLLISAIAFAVPDKDKDWKDYKAKHRKIYRNAVEEEGKKKNFEKNFQKIKENNAKFQKGEVTYELGENEYADLSSEEFLSLYATLHPPEGEALLHRSVRAAPLPPLSVSAAPSSVNWTAMGAVTPVKNQGSCGSCWAFSAAGAIESCKFLATNILTNVSEQHLVDCSWSYGNNGCNGGWMNSAFKYVNATGGIQTMATYPYTAKNETCKFNSSFIGAKIKGFVSVQSKNETALMEAVSGRPVCIGVDASGIQLYKSGVYNNVNCTTALNHGMLATGYGTDSVGGDYWIVKNSWGPKWGRYGYILMSRNRGDQCGIASAASYPVGCT